MYKRISLTLSELKTKDLKIGDKIVINDGSSISIKDEELAMKYDEIYIVYAFSELTGTNLSLHSMVGTVEEINVKDKFIAGVDNRIYQQDIVIKLGNCLFRTNSSMVMLKEE